MLGFPLLGLTIGLVSAALAHGPAPAALSVLRASDSSPALIRTNIGLAMTRGDGAYTYVCPSRWDGNERALAEARPDDVVVSSAGELFRSEDLCEFTPITRDDETANALVSTASAYYWASEPFPIEADRAEQEIVRFRDGSREVIGEVGRVDTSIARGEVALFVGHQPTPFIARVADDELVIVNLGLESERLSLREVSDDLSAAHIVSRSGDTLTLYEVDLVSGDFEEGVSGSVIHGPVQLGDALLVQVDGEAMLFARGSDQSDPPRSLGAPSFTCLERVGDALFACTLRATLRVSLEDGALITTPAFSMDQMAPPEGCPASDCMADWNHFGGESGWLDTDPALEPLSERRSPDVACCSLGYNASVPIAPGLMFALLFVIRRRCGFRSD